MLPLNLVADDRDRLGRGIGRGIGGKDLELDGSARSAADHFDELLQWNTMDLEELVVALRQGDDAVALVDLAGKFRRRARKQLLHDRVSVLDSEGGADADRRGRADGRQGRVMFGGIRY